ncbi:type II secretion system protein M [Acinetobacter chinensis]|uniref:Type II secretion system protein M n=1 Tax=Acinetobacter chinensis TaxID=2004650 RepID=A0A3B7M1C0_9GAMM|nr:type II secretion system protein GspM [Acinetobacter chinensis]AXY56479.1 type II secretion system protein M [Acinetobacter chinensis]
MEATDKLQQQLGSWSEKISDYLDSLSTRERLLVIFTCIFVVVVGVGSAIWAMYTAAEKQQDRVRELKDTVVWMQSNAVTMKPATDLELSASDKVQRIAQQQGLSVASQQQGDQIQLVVTHQNYSVLAVFLTQLAQMGLSIEKMELISEAGQIKLTATVQ